MTIEIVKTGCPKCQSNNKETIAFGRDIFRYKCRDCECMYQVYYERFPVKVEIFEYKKRPPMTIEDVCRDREYDVT